MERKLYPLILPKIMNYADLTPVKTLQIKSTIKPSTPHINESMKVSFQSNKAQ